MLKLFLEEITVSALEALGEGLLEENKMPVLLGKATNDASRSNLFIAFTIIVFLDLVHKNI